MTPERLRHWAGQINRVKAAKYAIPMHWDHATDTELLEPIKLDVLHERKSRSAQNTIGKLVDFQVPPSGDYAEITIETLTERASEAASTNAVAVSPVIFSEWKDGEGNVYTDTIGSIDMVDYPVDNSQGPFIPLQSPTQALSCRTFRMSTSTKAAPSVFRMAADTEGDANPFESQDAMEPQSDPVDNTSMGDSAPEQSGGTNVSDVLAALSQLGIVLPDDTTTESFLERLRPALLTAIASKQQPEEPEEQMATSLPPQDDDKPILANQPPIAAMSALQQRLHRLEQERIASTRSKLGERLQSLVEAGRCTPFELGEKKRVLQVQKLSLRDDCSVNAGDLEVWIASREALPKGAVWPAGERLQKLGTKPVEAPTSYDHRGADTPEMINEAVEALTRRHR